MEECHLAVTGKNGVLDIFLVPDGLGTVQTEHPRHGVQVVAPLGMQAARVLEKDLLFSIRHLAHLRPGQHLVVLELDAFGPAPWQPLPLVTRSPALTAV